MRKVVLIYNPESGQHSDRRSAVIQEALQVLRAAGVEAEAWATTAPGSAAAHAAEAVGRGCDAVVVCGGDGTVHEAIQSLVGSDVALGVVPLGTANALAADLGMSLSPVKAVRMLLDAVPERVPVGRIHYKDVEGAMLSRYFTVAAGIGADALLMSRLDAKLKRRFGYALYAVEGLKVLLTHPFPLFEAVFEEPGKSGRRVEKVSQIMSVRIRNFGGMLNHLVPGAKLRNTRLRLMAFKTSNRFHYMRFLAAAFFGRQTFASRIELLDAISVECPELPGGSKDIFVEADGELLGSLPVRLEIVPDALTLLMPVKRS
jgi:YegS/Rv2252/BmrU family lipid kinase